MHQLFLCLGFSCLAAASIAADEPCHPITTFAAGKVPQSETYVSPEGDDGRGDGSYEQPYQTIGRALRETDSGDAVRLLPGTYDGGVFIEGLNGTEAAPIWLGGIPGQAKPVFRGGVQALHLSRVRYVVIEHMKIVGSSQNGINCDDGGQRGDPEATRHVVFKNIEFQDIGTGGNQDALKLSGVNSFFVLDCLFEDGSAGGSGIDHVGCHEGVIARCRFERMGDNGIQCKGGSEDIEIRWNRFINGGHRAINIGGSTGFQFFRPPLSTDAANFEARNIRVLANLFEGSTAPVAFVGTVDSVVANNTMVDPEKWVVRILQETRSTDSYEFPPCGNNAFVNNLIFFNRSQVRTDVNIGPGTEPGSFNFSHNLWYAQDQPAESKPNLPAAETASMAGEAPEFVDVDSGDYRIPPTSPAAGRGSSIAGLEADIRNRCYTDPPSIGAFEVEQAAAKSDDS